MLTFSGGQYGEIVTSARHIKVLCCVAVACVATSVFACGEFAPCEMPLRLPPIQSITVLEASTTNPHSSDTQANCALFALSAKDTRKYLRKARRISASAYLHQVDASRCVARGSLRFKDQKGNRSEWHIGQQREAKLLRPHAKPIYLYCSRCTERPFVQ